MAKEGQCGKHGKTVTGAGARVLVVDDEPKLRELFRLSLQSEGIQVLEAENGRKALALLADQAVDLVITDLIMPEMEGLETIQAIRKQYPHIRIIAMSGGGRNSPEIYLLTARKMGAHAVLAKPFDRRLLIDTVNSLLRE